MRLGGTLHPNTPLLSPQLHVPVLVVHTGLHDQQGQVLRTNVLTNPRIKLVARRGTAESGL